MPERGNGTITRQKWLLELAFLIDGSMSKGRRKEEQAKGNDREGKKQKRNASKKQKKNDNETTANNDAGMW